MEYLIESESSQASLPLHSMKILERILIPCCAWKPGKPVVKIRKASITCIMRLIERNLLDKTELYKKFKTIMDSIKNCMDDDWADDLRFASCAFIKRLLIYLNELFVNTDLDNIQEPLFKMMDDKQDSIRIEMSKGLIEFYKSVKPDWNIETYEKTINLLFIHYDDTKKEIRDAVKEVLLTAAPLYKKEFIEIV